MPADSSNVEWHLFLLLCLSIGPRFVLNPIRIFEGSFGGPTLFQNPHYVSPNDVSKMLLLYTTKMLLKYMYMNMIGTINMEMNGPCKYMYMYFSKKKALCTLCMMRFWNIYAMPHVFPQNNLTKHTYQEITKFIFKKLQYLLAIIKSVCPYLVLVFYSFCINSYERGYWYICYHKK